MFTVIHSHSFRFWAVQNVHALLRCETLWMCLDGSLLYFDLVWVRGHEFVRRRSPLRLFVEVYQLILNWEIYGEEEWNWTCWVEVWDLMKVIKRRFKNTGLGCHFVQSVPKVWWYYKIIWNKIIVAYIAECAVLGVFRSRITVTVHPKIKLLSWFTNPFVFSNLYNWLSSAEHIIRPFEKCW